MSKVWPEVFPRPSHRQSTDSVNRESWLRFCSVAEALDCRSLLKKLFPNENSRKIGLKPAAMVDSLPLSLAGSQSADQGRAAIRKIRFEFEFQSACLLMHYDSICWKFRLKLSIIFTAPSSRVGRQDQEVRWSNPFEESIFCRRSCAQLAQKISNRKNIYRRKRKSCL